MKFTYHAAMCPVDQYLPLAKAVEEHGFYGFTMPDSICYPKEADSTYPYNGDGSREFLEHIPFLEPFSAIPAMSVVAPQLRYSTSVVKLPIRNPVLVAKQVATVAVMTRNNFAFGIGLSPWKEDFDICGERWEKRGPRMDEMITIIRGLLRGDFFGFEGEFYNIPAAKICPVPSLSVPILIGGHADVALKRAARSADGWIHAGGDYESLKTAIDKINFYRKEYGTNKNNFEIHAMTADAFSLDGVMKLEAIGVTESIVGFRNPYEGKADNTSLEQKIAQIRWFADNIIAKTAPYKVAV
jgi:alkanesulfonate monooxygenase SsuD/methylene tetrahydromethanopterin reductase-like flavin-dependent oxidoreductase (luciferase family)